MLQSQQFIDYSFFLKYILPPEGYSNEQVDAALVGLVVGGSRGHGRSHRYVLFHTYVMLFTITFKCSAHTVFFDYVGWSRCSKRPTFRPVVQVWW